MRKTIPLFLFLMCNTLFAQNVLYVGNSLTYSNNLPEMVETIGKSLRKKIKTQCICFPNYALEDHLNDGIYQRIISNNEFDFVIFQQGPSSQAYGRTSLHQYGAEIVKLAKAKNAQPAYFMVWPSVQYYETFDGVIKNHTDAAKANEALLIPVGEVWRQYRKNNAGYADLYVNDQFHPSTTGSFIAAIVQIKTLFPEVELSKLKYGKFDQWVANKATFDRIIELATNL